MKTLGLTGSIGMGKSTTSALFAEAGAPVYDADAAVHAIYAKGGPAAAPLEAEFPGCTRDGAVDRQKLSAQVLGRPEKLQRLEAIVHPLLAQQRAAFFEGAAQSGAPWVFWTCRSCLKPAVIAALTPWLWSPPRPNSSAPGCWRVPT